MNQCTRTVILGALKDSKLLVLLKDSTYLHSAKFCIFGV